MKITTKQDKEIETQSDTKITEMEKQHRIVVTLSGKMLRKLDILASEVGFYGQKSRANTIRHLIINAKVEKENENSNLL